MSEEVCPRCRVSHMPPGELSDASPRSWFRFARDTACSVVRLMDSALARMDDAELASIEGQWAEGADFGPNHERVRAFLDQVEAERRAAMELRQLENDALAAARADQIFIRQQRERREQEGK